MEVLVMEQAIFLKKEQRQLKTDLHFDYCGISKTLPFHAFGPAIRQNYTLHIVMEGKGTYQVKNQQPSTVNPFFMNLRICSLREICSRSASLSIWPHISFVR